MREKCLSKKRDMVETFSSYYVPLVRRQMRESGADRIRMLTHAHTLPVGDSVSGHSGGEEEGKARTIPRSNPVSEVQRRSIFRTSRGSDKRERNVLPRSSYPRAFSVWHFVSGDIQLVPLYFRFLTAAQFSPDFIQRGSLFSTIKSWASPRSWFNSGRLPNEHWWHEMPKILKQPAGAPGLLAILEFWHFF